MSKARISPDGRSVSVRVPMKLAKRGGRKLIIAPDGASTLATTRPRVDSTLIKALARGFRWRKLLETGVFATVEDIAKHEKIDSTYVGRILRLTLLAPTIVESVLDGRQAGNMMLAGFMRAVPAMWTEQARLIASLSESVIALDAKSGRAVNQMASRTACGHALCSRRSTISRSTRRSIPRMSGAFCGSRCSRRPSLRPSSTGGKQEP